MREVAIELQQWLDNNDGLQTLMKQINVELSPIIWADDIAVPVCTAQAVDLVPLVTDLLTLVIHIFETKGFRLNLAHGKTAAVLTFKGVQAPQCRQQYLLVPHPGVTCHTREGASVWLHFEPKYRHLGTRYAADLSLTVELQHRAGQAFAAFQQMSRPLFTNKHYPVLLRLRLFKALVCTKLLFGAGAWHTPTLRQLHKLRRAWVKLLQRTLRINPADQHMTNLEVCLKAREPDIRAKLASERLLYAQRFFAHAPAIVHHLAHIEYQSVPDSWLHGLQADLCWLHDILPQQVPLEWTKDFTNIIDFWQSGGKGWKSTVKKALKLHIHQEALICEAKSFHQKIYRIWIGAGATFSSSPLDCQDRQLSHLCSCGKAFSTPQGLAAHRWKAHGQFSPEHVYLTDATCAHCLKFFWTTQRLQQHLAYMPRNGQPNACFAALEQKFSCFHMPEWIFRLQFKGWTDEKLSRQKGHTMLVPHTMSDRLPVGNKPSKLAKMNLSSKLSLQSRSSSDHNLQTSCLHRLGSGAETVMNIPVLQLWGTVGSIT